MGIDKVVVVGGGIMGTGIAQVVAAADLDVTVVDVDEKALESSLAESLAEIVPEVRTVSEQEFGEVVGEALETVGGTLLFKICAENDGEGEHVAAAAVGDGPERQFLLLTLPTAGGKLKVETASKSANPAAGSAEAYAGLMDVFRAAA